jgi:hypothetical protein
MNSKNIIYEHKMEMHFQLFLDNWRKWHIQILDFLKI